MEEFYLTVSMDCHHGASLTRLLRGDSTVLPIQRCSGHLALVLAHLCLHTLDVALIVRLHAVLAGDDVESGKHALVVRQVLALRTRKDCCVDISMIYADGISKLYQDGAGGVEKSLE